MVSATPDNANPIIHTSTSATRRSRKRADSLDLSDDDEWARLANNSSDEEGGGGGGGGYQGTRDDQLQEEIDGEEIFDLIRGISDPEHPLTLEQLAVVSAAQISVTHGSRPHVLVEFTPTIPHCSMATLIGLSLRVRLLRSLPERFKVDIKVKEGTHQSENAGEAAAFSLVSAPGSALTLAPSQVNKQLNDKERVAAALENTHLVSVVQQCLSTADQKSKGV